MFGGTGVFTKHTCPFLRSPRSQTNPPAGTTCGRPHCKFNHELAETSGQHIAIPTVQRSSSSEPPVIALEFPVAEALLTDLSTTLQTPASLEAKELFEGTDTQQNIPPDGVFLMPDLDDSILAVQLNGLLGLPAPDANMERPSYSDTPTNQSSVEQNYYLTSYDEPHVNDMIYDPAHNWSMNGCGARQTAASPVTTAPQIVVKEEPMITGEPAFVPVQINLNLTGAAALRNRMAVNDSLIALGRKGAPVAGSLNGFKNTGLIAPVSGGGVKRPLSPGLQVTRNPPQNGLQRRKLPVSPGADNQKPVKKKAKFGRSAEDEEPMEVEARNPAVRIKKDSTDQTEIMKHLFGDEDDDEESDVVLPIEMRTKPVPRGFPKNPEKLLQTMAAVSQEASRPQRPLNPLSAQARPLPPLKKKMPPTQQQQLELRAKALEEQRKKATVAASGAVAGTVDKGSARVAHQLAPLTSASTGLPMPRVGILPGCKITLPFRQQVLEKFIQILSTVYRSPMEVAEKAMQTEIEIAKFSFHTGIYRTKVTEAIANFKNVASPATSSASSSVGSGAEVKPPAVAATRIHPVVTSAPGSQRHNYSTAAPQRTTAMDPKLWSDQDFHSAIKRYLVSEDELVVEGYPLVQSKKNDGENRQNGIQLYIAMSGKITPDRITQTKRACCRCKKDFVVDFEGNYVKDEECIYHWGKAFPRRVSGEGMIAKRSCCSEDASSRGCSVAMCHVADTIPSLSGFVSTAGVKPRADKRFGVYAIDCEMIYTVGGMEVARITVVDRQLKCVYESLVRPKQRIVDCNTRFSGLKMEQFAKDAQGNSKAGIKTIEEIHKDLLGDVINEDTILIGHSLESDLLAMKFIHRNIVDTSLVFPHKRGRPLKRALRTLMRETLEKIIQEDAGGHDSREDASACMELMVYKLREDRERRR